MNMLEPVPADAGLSVRMLCEPPPDVAVRQVVQAERFGRRTWAISDRAICLRDDFRDAGDASCTFVRVTPGTTGTVRFVLDGLYGLTSCRSGGWLLEPADLGRPTYWIPQRPVMRRYDGHGRILAEAAATLLAAVPSAAGSVLEVESRADSVLELVIWQLPAPAAFVHELQSPRVIEQQPVFMLSSHTSYVAPADAYLVLLHGYAYENRFDFKKKRKICSELEAYSLYLALLGLETATGKAIYRALRQQVVCSVIARQEPDGGWRHGEWSDFMETHFRFQSAAMLMLAAELEQAPDQTVRTALARAAGFIASRADRTDIGLWFLHDSLEESEELLTKSGARWVASRELGKAPATKMILNTHLDTTVALDRYQEVTGDRQYADRVASALDATRTLLALRPAEPLYRALYWAVGLTLLPAQQARELSLPLRALRRLTTRYLVRRLHHVKRRFPRIVMPGGLVDRHLSRLHFGVNYHSVNIADLVRLWRRFPDASLGGVIDGAVAAVTGTSMLQFWLELRQRQSLGYWVEALYHLCTLRQDMALRERLAQAIMSATDAALGLPPALLGSHPEAVAADQRIPCPSPSDARLRVANLSRRGSPEFLVVNPTRHGIDLVWPVGNPHRLTWAVSSGGNADPARVPARGWLWGRVSK
jgi:hypothetical protein